MEEVCNFSWELVGAFVAASNFLAFGCCLFFLISMLTSKKGILRGGGGSNTFNVYIFFLIVPDAFNTLFQGLANSFGIGYDGRCIKFPFKFNFFHINAYFMNLFFGTNIYLNAILTYEMNILVRRSYQRMKTPPPKLRRALIQVICVYVLSALWALGNLIKLPWSETYINYDESGRVVTSMSLSVKVIYSFMVNSIPIFYVLAIQALTWWKKLLPKSGRTRVVSLFFLRIIIVFLLSYMPMGFMFLCVSTTKSQVIKFWMWRGVALCSTFQAIFTLFIISKKDDINQLLSDNLQKLVIGPYRRSIAPLSTFLFGRSSSSKNESLQEEEDEGGDEYNEIEDRNVTTKKSQWDEEDVYDDNRVDNGVDCCMEEGTMEEDIISSLKLSDETKTKEFNNMKVTTEKNKKNNVGENNEEKSEL